MPVTFRTTGTVTGPSFFLRREGGLAPVQMPITCAIVERPDGLMLIDTGWSRAQCAWPERDPGWATKLLLGMRVRAEDALASQLISLGYEPGDVRHVVATHLHVDHIGGAVDFPAAKVHATEREWAARSRGRRGGYVASSLEFKDRLALHGFDGPAMLGFPASHDLFGDGSVMLLEARGHTEGSTAVAVKLQDRWLIHVGDACMFREDYADTRTAKPSLYARVQSHDLEAQQRTFAALRTAESEHHATIVPSHDPAVFAALPTTTEAGYRGAWEQQPKAKKQPQPQQVQAQAGAKQSQQQSQSSEKREKRAEKREPREPKPAASE